MSDAAGYASKDRMNARRAPGIRTGLVMLLSMAGILFLLRTVIWAAEFARNHTDEVRDSQPAASDADRAPTPTPTAEPHRTVILLGRVRIPTPTPTPMPTPDGRFRQSRIPILMYHYIDRVPPHADAIRRDLTVTPSHFAEHLDRIQSLGYQTVSLHAVVRHLTYGAPLPEQPIVLTFDDGYVNHYTYALPLLQERDMTGTFFVISTFPASGNNSYMTWDMIRELMAAGMEIESHAQFHETLAGQNSAYVRAQAEGSARTFERELGYTPRIIAYPMGHYDDNAIQGFQARGYWAGVTTLNGNLHASDQLFHLHRVRIHGRDTADHVEWLLSEDGQAWLTREQAANR